MTTGLKQSDQDGKGSRVSVAFEDGNGSDVPGQRFLLAVLNVTNARRGEFQSLLGDDGSESRGSLEQLYSQSSSFKNPKSTDLSDPVQREAQGSQASNSRVHRRLRRPKPSLCTRISNNVYGVLYTAEEDFGAAQRLFEGRGFVCLPLASGTKAVSPGWRFFRVHRSFEAKGVKDHDVAQCAPKREESLRRDIVRSLYVTFPKKLQQRTLILGPSGRRYIGVYGSVPEILDETGLKNVGSFGSESGGVVPRDSGSRLESNVEALTLPRLLEQYLHSSDGWGLGEELESSAAYHQLKPEDSEGSALVGSSPIPPSLSSEQFTAVSSAMLEALVVRELFCRALEDNSVQNCSPSCFSAQHLNNARRGSAEVRVVESNPAAGVFSPAMLLACREKARDETSENPDPALFPMLRSGVPAAEDDPHCNMEGTGIRGERFGNKTRGEVGPLFTASPTARRGGFGWDVMMDRGEGAVFGRPETFDRALQIGSSMALPSWSQRPVGGGLFSTPATTAGFPFSWNSQGSSPHTAYLPRDTFTGGGSRVMPGPQQQSTGQELLRLLQHTGSNFGGFSGTEFLEALRSKDTRSIWPAYLDHLDRDPFGLLSGRQLYCRPDIGQQNYQHYGSQGRAHTAEGWKGGNPSQSTVVSRGGLTLAPEEDTDSARFSLLGIVSGCRGSTRGAPLPPRHAAPAVVPGLGGGQTRQATIAAVIDLVRESSTKEIPFEQLPRVYLSRHGVPLNPANLGYTSLKEFILSVPPLSLVWIYTGPIRPEFWEVRNALRLGPEPVNSLRGGTTTSASVSQAPLPVSQQAERSGIEDGVGVPKHEDDAVSQEGVHQQISNSKGWPCRLPSVETAILTEKHLEGSGNFPTTGLGTGWLNNGGGLGVSKSVSSGGSTTCCPFTMERCSSSSSISSVEPPVPPSAVYVVERSPSFSKVACDVLVALVAHWVLLNELFGTRLGSSGSFNGGMTDAEQPAVQKQSTALKGLPTALPAGSGGRSSIGLSAAPSSPPPPPPPCFGGCPLSTTAGGISSVGMPLALLARTWETNWSDVCSLQSLVQRAGSETLEELVSLVSSFYIHRTLPFGTLQNGDTSEEDNSVVIYLRRSTRVPIVPELVPDPTTAAYNAPSGQGRGNQVVFFPPAASQHIGSLSVTAQEGGVRGPLAAGGVTGSCVRPGNNNSARLGRNSTGGIEGPIRSMSRRRLSGITKEQEQHFTERYLPWKPELFAMLYELISVSCEWQRRQWEAGEDLVAMQEKVVSDDEKVEGAESGNRLKGFEENHMHPHSITGPSDVINTQPEDSAEGNGDGKGKASVERGRRSRALKHQRRRERREERRQRMSQLLNDTALLAGRLQEKEGSADEKLDAGEALLEGTSDQELGESDGERRQSSTTTTTHQQNEEGEDGQQQRRGKEVERWCSTGTASTGLRLLADSDSRPSSAVLRELLRKAERSPAFREERQRYRNRSVGIFVSSIKLEWSRYFEGALPLTYFLDKLKTKKLKCILEEIPNLVLTGDGGFIRVSTVDHARQYANPFPPEGFSADGKSVVPSVITLQSTDPKFLSSTYVGRFFKSQDTDSKACEGMVVTEASKKQIDSGETRIPCTASLEAVTAAAPVNSGEVGNATTTVLGSLASIKSKGALCRTLSKLNGEVTVRNPFFYALAIPDSSQEGTRKGGAEGVSDLEGRTGGINAPSIFKNARDTRQGFAWSNTTSQIPGVGGGGGVCLTTTPSVLAVWDMSEAQVREVLARTVIDVVKLHAARQRLDRLKLVKSEGDIDKTAETTTEGALDKKQGGPISGAEEGVKTAPADSDTVVVSSPADSDTVVISSSESVSEKYPFDTEGNGDRRLVFQESSDVRHVTEQQQQPYVVDQRQRGSGKEGVDPNDNGALKEEQLVSVLFTRSGTGNRKGSFFQSRDLSSLSEERQCLVKQFLNDGITGLHIADLPSKWNHNFVKFSPFSSFLKKAGIESVKHPQWSRFLDTLDDVIFRVPLSGPSNKDLSGARGSVVASSQSTDISAKQMDVPTDGGVACHAAGGGDTALAGDNGTAGYVLFPSSAVFLEDSNYVRPPEMSYSAWMRRKSLSYVQEQLRSAGETMLPEVGPQTTGSDPARGGGFNGRQRRRATVARGPPGVVGFVEGGDPRSFGLHITPPTTGTPYRNRRGRFGTAPPQALGQFQDLLVATQPNNNRRTGGIPNGVSAFVDGRGTSLNDRFMRQRSLGYSTTGAGGVRPPAPPTRSTFGFGKGGICEDWPYYSQSTAPCGTGGSSAASLYTRFPQVHHFDSDSCQSQGVGGSSDDVMRSLRDIEASICQQTATMHQVALMLSAASQKSEKLPPVVASQVAQLLTQVGGPLQLTGCSGETGFHNSNTPGSRSTPQPHPHRSSVGTSKNWSQTGLPFFYNL